MSKTVPTDENIKNDKKSKRYEKKGGFLGKLMLSAISLALIGLVAVLGFDVAGLRERYLRNMIDNIPIVKAIFPAPLHQSPFNDDADPYNLMTNTELISQLRILQGEIDKLNKDKEDMQKRIGLYTAELEKLRDIQEQHEQFKGDKSEFDKLVAMRDPTAYTKFYESISPENADNLYPEAVLISNRAQELKRLTNTVSSMEERASAKMLEALMSTDMDLVVMMLKNISVNTSGLIIESMSPENAAAVVKRMAPPAESR